MGGSGGGGGRSLGDTRDLEERAREILRQGQSGRKNVFISFAFEDLDEVNLLRGQAKSEKSDIEFNDLSVREAFDSERAEYIRQKIRERINRCFAVIVYLSAATAASRWVRWEVEKGLELGKRVIAVHSGDTPPENLPAFIRDQGIKVVRWSDLADELSSG